MLHTLHSFCADKKENVEERINEMIYDQLKKILETKAIAIRKVVCCLLLTE
jgi:hypothetical protein